MTVGRTPPVTEALKLDQAAPYLSQFRLCLRRGDSGTLARMLAASSTLFLLASRALAALEAPEQLEQPGAEPLLQIPPIARVTLRRALARASLGPVPPADNHDPRGKVAQG